jgi:glycosyltransferase involved in cell wall biosynthesis
MLNNNRYYKVTVITICYNASKDLAKTIDSVASQTYTDIEYIVIDGGSQDDTLEVINSKLNVITQYISEPDKGIYDAMNKGIDMATGDWIIFMNAGDVFYSHDVIEKLCDNIYELNTGIVYGDVVLDFGKCGKLTKSLHRFNNENVALQLCHQAMMTRSDILKIIKYDTSYRIIADLNSFRKIEGMGCRFEYVPIIFAVFEVLDGVSSTMPLAMFYESCRNRGIKKYSRLWWYGYFEALCKYVLRKLLPKDIYNRLRFKKVSSVKMYWPIDKIIK